MTINKKEVLRYMGHRKGDADGRLMALIDSICLELERSARPAYVWRDFPISVNDNTVTISGIKIKSRRLAAHLSDCSSAAVLAATLGAASDSVIRKSFALGTVNGTAAQAAGAAMIEAVCDKACSEIAESTHLHTKPRFSPGYGDFTLEHQKDMISLCDATRRAGITLTDSLMMIPTKSVTAIVGLTADKMCADGGCANCEKKDCEFRV